MNERPDSPSSRLHGMRGEEGFFQLAPLCPNDTKCRMWPMLSKEKRLFRFRYDPRCQSS